MYNVCQPICRYDGIGRRDGLKIRWWQHRVGSSPTTGTSSSQASYRLRRVFHFIAKLIARLFCCSSLPNRTRCRWAPVWGRRFAAVLSILRSKVRFALASFYAQGKKDIIRPLPYFPFPTATRCAGPAVGRQPSGVAFHAPSPNPLDGGFINSLEGRSGRMSSPALEAVSAWGEVERPGRRAGRRARCSKRRFWVRIHAPPGSTPAAPPRCPAVFLHCLQCPRPQCFPRCL